MRAKKEKKPKLPAGITDEFVDRVSALDNDSKKALIVELQKHIDDSKEFLKTKQEIVDAREALKEMEGPAKETIKHMTNRTKFLIDDLKKTGGL
jgi:hypothetical protein